MRRSNLAVTLDAVVAALPPYCRDRLAELERTFPPPKAGDGRTKAAKGRAALVAALERAAGLAASLGPLWHGVGAGIAWAAHAAREAGRGTALALPARRGRRRSHDPAQLVLWDAA